MEITRKFCDRCKKETDKLTEIHNLQLTTQYQDFSSNCVRDRGRRGFVGHKVEVCVSCRKEIVDLLGKVWDNFMTFAEKVDQPKEE